MFLFVIGQMLPATMPFILRHLQPDWKTLDLLIDLIMNVHVTV